MAKDDDKPYEVGFRKPPKDKQFVKGTTGNPKGRPKGAKSMNSILAKTGRERITVNVNGKTKLMTRNEAVVMQLTNKAMSGDPRATRDYFAAHRLFPEPNELSAGAAVTNDRDEALLASVHKRMLEAVAASTDELSMDIDANDDRETK